MPPHHSSPNSKTSKNSSNTPPTLRRTSTTSTTATAYDETTCLLPHEQPPPPSTTSTTSTASTSLHQILALHPHRIAILEQARLDSEALTPTSNIPEQDLEAHVLSRIDCIEIDLWHERIRDYEAAELGQIAAAELGKEEEDE
ncbi:hypothetical protein E4T43_02604 [Aureobasidium subglaciale]|nr:hypothetical protein E4T43_02604 [Aureobasidium subglaciale]